MTARITRSEPDQAFRQPPTAWQRDRMGRVQPMKRLYFWPPESHGETLPMSRVERRCLYALVPIASLACVIAWCWS